MINITCIIFLLFGHEGQCNWYFDSYWQNVLSQNEEVIYRYVNANEDVSTLLCENKFQSFFNHKLQTTNPISASDFKSLDDSLVFFNENLGIEYLDEAISILVIHPTYMNYYNSITDNSNGIINLVSKCPTTVEVGDELVLIELNNRIYKLSQSKLQDVLGSEGKDLFYKSVDQFCGNSLLHLCPIFVSTQNKRVTLQNIIRSCRISENIQPSFATN